MKNKQALEVSNKVFLNVFGKNNAATAKEFETKNLDYQEWTNPTKTQDTTLTIGKQTLTIKVWDRNPLEDLFVGSKTTCCTAPNGCNGGSTPLYLANTAINVIELYDANGNVVAMSRIFMAEVDGVPSLVMDNFEAGSYFMKDLNNDQLTTLGNAFFDYARQLAENVGGKDTPVYFSENYTEFYQRGIMGCFGFTQGRYPTKLIGQVNEYTYINSGGSTKGETRVRF